MTIFVMVQISPGHGYSTLMIASSRYFQIVERRLVPGPGTPSDQLLPLQYLDYKFPAQLVTTQLVVNMTAIMDQFAIQE